MSLTNVFFLCGRHCSLMFCVVTDANTKYDLLTLLTFVSNNKQPVRLPVHDQTYELDGISLQLPHSWSQAESSPLQRQMQSLGTLTESRHIFYLGKSHHPPKNYTCTEITTIASFSSTLWSHTSAETNWCELCFNVVCILSCNMN